MNWCTPFLAICFSSCATLAAGSEPVSVFGTRIEGLLEEDTTGPYHQVFQLLVEGFPDSATMTIAPFKRAEAQFLGKNSQCLFAGSEIPDYYPSLGLPADQLLISNRIFRIQTKIYGPKGVLPIESFDALRSQTVAIDSGVGGVRFVAGIMGQDMTNVLTVQSPVQGFQLLEAGRVSAMIAVDLDVKFLQSREPYYRGYSVSPDFFIHESYDVFVCHKSEKSVEFLKHINKRLEILKGSNSIEKLMDQYLAARTANNKSIP